jgi:hypothetical protein
MQKLKIRSLTAGLVLLIIGSCQKQNQEDSFNPTNPNTDETLLQRSANLIQVQLNANLLEKAATLEEGGEEDVEVVTTGIPKVQLSDVQCIQNPAACPDVLSGSMVSDSVIMPGFRLGVRRQQNLNGGSNSITEYNLPCRRVNGYNAHEKTFRLKLLTDSTYRIQVTPKEATRNVDAFIYKLVVKQGKIVRKLMTWGIHPAGKSETMEISGAGYYLIVVDAQSEQLDNDFLISVSSHTRIGIQSKIDNGITEYQLNAPPYLNHKKDKWIGWSFRKVGLFNAPSEYFSKDAPFAFNCTCDWLVTPIYQNQQTGLQAPYKTLTTVIRP